MFDVDFDKERAAWDVVGSSDYKKDGVEATNGFAFGVSQLLLSLALGGSSATAPVVSQLLTRETPPHS